MSELMLTAADYARAQGKSLRTIQRWLRDGLLAGADQSSGQWLIPADATPTTPATSYDVSRVAPTAGAGVMLPTSYDVAPVAPLGMLGTLEEAAAALGTTVGGVRRLGRDGHLVVGRYGPRGALRVFVPPRG